MIIDTFPETLSSPYVAMDTETRTYVDDKLMTEEQIYRMCAEVVVRHGIKQARYPPAWWREHARVECYAYLVYAPEGFAILETFDEWSDFCARHKVAHAWWYNAPFDFSILDWQMLSRGWQHVRKITGAEQYKELASDFGQRYSMTIAHPAKTTRGKPSRRLSRHYDLRNILHGGLAKLLNSFDVKDADGKPIRKLEIDYQGEGWSEERIAYMRNDVAGLWWLIDTAGALFSSELGLDIRQGRPDFLTASGMSKKVVLRLMYPGAANDTLRMWRFRKDHPMDMQTDEYFRRHGLLQGGRVLVNPDFQGRELNGVKGFRIDCNSEYPAQAVRLTKEKRHLCGYPRVFGTLEDAVTVMPPHSVFILELSELHAIVKPGMLPCWMDPFKHTMGTTFHINKGDPSLCIFLDEYLEYGHWYEIESKIARVIAYEGCADQAVGDFMAHAYARKSEAKAVGNFVLADIWKVPLNGYLGKYSQNPRREVITRELRDGIVRLVCEEEEEDEKSLFHVAEGAWITANGRIWLLQQVRKQTGGKVRERLWYTDTDSIHAIGDPADTDPYTLGGWKLENKKPITQAKFLAPKAYYEVEENGAMSIHSKGVNVERIEELVKRGVPLDKIYTPGYKVQSLSALNVRGGKALLPFPKDIARPDSDEQELEIEKWQ